VSASIYKNYFSDIGFLNRDFYNEYTSRFGRQADKNHSNLNDRLGYEMQNTSLKGYLKCEDRCSMWHGVESRTPFSDDHELIEAVFALPAALKIHDGTSKILLREAARSFIPPEIAHRKDKMGYATPNNRWINQAAPAFKDLFTPDLAPFLNLAKLNKEYTALFNQSQNNDTGRIFKFISFAAWMKVFFRDENKSV